VGQDSADVDTLSDRRSDDKSQGDETQGGTSDNGNALRTLAAATAALQAGKLFSAATRREPFRLNTIDDVAEAYASGVPLTGDEVVRAFWILRDEMKARGLPLDWYSSRRREDEPLQ